MPCLGLLGISADIWSPCFAQTGWLQRWLLFVCILHASMALSALFILLAFLKSRPPLLLGWVISTELIRWIIFVAWLSLPIYSFYKVYQAPCAHPMVTSWSALGKLAGNWWLTLPEFFVPPWKDTLISNLLGFFWPLLWCLSKLYCLFLCAPNESPNICQGPKY